MIVLNVLPPSLKEKFELDRLKTALNAVLVISLFILITSVASMFMGLWMTGFLEEVTTESSTALESNAQIIDFNASVKRIEDVQHLFFKYSETFAKITNAIPVDVQIREISIDGEHQLVTIVGDTEQKSLIFETKDRVQEIEELSEIRLATDELITKTRKSFTITATVKASSL